MLDPERFAVGLAIPRVPVTDALGNPNSSNLRSLGYDDERHVLEVEFRSGETWRYADVPAGLVSRVRTAESPGRVFIRTIRDRFLALRMESDGEGVRPEPGGLQPEVILARPVPRPAVPARPPSVRDYAVDSGDAVSHLAPRPDGSFPSVGPACDTCGSPMSTSFVDSDLAKAGLMRCAMGHVTLSRVTDLSRLRA